MFMFDLTLEVKIGFTLESNHRALPPLWREYRWGNVVLLMATAAVFPTD
jgi:hypothetical protein